MPITRISITRAFGVVAVVFIFYQIFNNFDPSTNLIWAAAGLFVFTTMYLIDIRYKEIIVLPHVNVRVYHFF